MKTDLVSQHGKTLPEQTCCEGLKPACEPIPRPPIDSRDLPPLSTQVDGGHYAKMAIQPAEFIHANDLDWFQGCVLKYLVRHWDKNGERDLRKAIHFLEMYIDLAYADDKPIKHQRESER